MWGQDTESLIYIFKLSQVLTDSIRTTAWKLAWRRAIWRSNITSKDILHCRWRRSCGLNLYASLKKRKKITLLRHFMLHRKSVVNVSADDSNGFLKLKKNPLDFLGSYERTYFSFKNNDKIIKITRKWLRYRRNSRKKKRLHQLSKSLETDFRTPDEHQPSSCRRPCSRCPSPFWRWIWWRRPSANWTCAKSNLVGRRGLLGCPKWTAPIGNILNFW